MTNQNSNSNSKMHAMHAQQAKANFSKPVVLTNLNTSECLTFASIKEASNYLEIPRDKIADAIYEDKIVCVDEYCYKARFKNVFQGFNPIILMREGEYMLFESAKAAAEHFKCSTPNFFRSKYKGYRIIKFKDISPNILTKLYKRGLLKNIAHLITDSKGQIRLDYFQRGL